MREGNSSAAVAAPLEQRQAPAHATLPLGVGTDHDYLVYCDNPLGTLVARCGGSGFEFTGWTKEQCTEMAAFLAHAANCHDELLEALKGLHADCVEYCRINHLHNDDGGPATNYAMRRAAEAIAKATQPAASRGEATPNSTAELGA